VGILQQQRDKAEVIVVSGDVGTQGTNLQKKCVINFVESKIIQLFVVWEMARADDKGICTGCYY